MGSSSAARRTLHRNRDTNGEHWLVPFEILHGSLMLFRRRARFEGAEIAAFAGFRISFREYSRYSPDCNFRIMGTCLTQGPPLELIARGPFVFPHHKLPFKARAPRHATQALRPGKRDTSKVHPTARFVSKPPAGLQKTPLLFVVGAGSVRRFQCPSPASAR